jgi:phosphopantothenoylcysteine decarboxylase/phosphopantothenate--cysteine ligase
MRTTAGGLLAEIEAFLATGGLTPTKFGLAAVNDGHLVAKLRRGSSVTLKTADRVRAFMAARRAGEEAPVSTVAAKPLLLIIGGGIAAYKCLDLVRRLGERGWRVRTIMTEAARQFITPLAVGALTGEGVFTELFDLDAEREIGHIRLAREAELIVVAPATADLIAKAAGGHANDLASCVLLAADTPVLMAPAMNPHMWLNAATRRNVALLAGDGVRFVGPNVGEMAERGEAGPGRMVEVPELLTAIDTLRQGAGERAGSGPLAGRHVLVTSGPTIEPIDPVRYIANRSSGKQGAAIAAEARALGARVTMISGPTHIAAPADVTAVRVETAREMLEATRRALPADIAIFAAAVADWRVAGSSEQKIKKGAAAAAPRLELVENPDILASIAAEPAGRRPALVIGFAAETERVIEHARLKRMAKGADWIVANDVAPHTGVMGGDRNRVHLITAEGVESWPELDKIEVARRLVLRAAERLSAMVAAP